MAIHPQAIVATALDHGMAITIREARQIAEYAAALGGNVWEAITQWVQNQDERSSAYVQWLRDSGEFDVMAANHHTRVALEEGRRHVMTRGGLANQQQPALSNSPHNEQDMSAQKRKKSEESGVEPEGHGNTPATGTKQAHYVEKYVPVNFPDKFTVKERYCSTYALVSDQASGTVPTNAYVIWNTNSAFAPFNSGGGYVVNPTNANHQPNQRDNWASQYGYYRVESMRYKITVSNVVDQTFIPTNFANSAHTSDAVVTLLRTQKATDITACVQENLWEQKLAHNHFLPSRSGGTSGAVHTFHGEINPEDYDMDPVTTAGDETWTAVGSSPTQPRLLALAVFPAFPSNTVNKLPEAAIVAFVEFTYTIQYAGYVPALRQACS